MILREISFQNPEENILFDDVLLQLAEQHQSGECLRFWESPIPFVVLGLSSKANEDLKWEHIEKKHIPVLRRSSGGGTVIQGRGCLNYAVVLSKTREGLSDLQLSYQIILGKIVETLIELSIDAQYFPISDIAIRGTRKKISGNAQRRGREYILQHGTILYDFPLDKISQCLLMPKKIPDYRGSRSHLDFVCNAAIDRKRFKEILAQKFGVETANNRLNQDEKIVLDTLIGTKNYAVNRVKASNLAF